MFFFDFSDLVEPYVTPRGGEFKKEIARQISNLKIKPKQYNDLFTFDKYRTGLDWSIDLENLIKNFRKGQGDLNKAIAFYFLFHNERPFYTAARNIDAVLFGDGVTFEKGLEEKLTASGLNPLPSSIIETDGNNVRNRAPRQSAKPASSPTDVILKVSELVNNKEFLDFFYYLDYEDLPGAFKFDPQTFPRSDDEKKLDQILLHLSIIGDILRRGEITIKDILWMDYIVKKSVGNNEVQKYLQWIQSSDQIPGHASFLGAIYLFEVLVGSLSPYPILEQYRKNAVIGGSKKDGKKV